MPKAAAEEYQSAVIMTRDGQLTVYLFNVGQGDHILLELPNGEYGIIDFYYEGTLGLREPPSLTYLENLRRLHPEKPITISFLCISHPDYDHVKGVDSFLDWAEQNAVVINNIWLPPGREIGELCNKYEVALRKYAKSNEEIDWGNEYKIRLGRIHRYVEKHGNGLAKDYLQGAVRSLNADLDDLKVILVAPLTEHLKEFDDDLLDRFFRLLITRKKATAQNNLMSSVLLMLLNGHRLLFGGDTTLEVWMDGLDAYDRSEIAAICGPCEGNFIKASHHGSRNSSSEELWQRILGDESVVGISAGQGKGHPHEAVLRDIRRAAHQKHSQTQVLSTNSCTECIINDRVPEERLNELAGAPPDYAPETKLTNRRLRSSSAASGQPEDRSALATYVFRFSLNNGERHVSKVLMSTLADAIECIYPNANAQSFPDCAI